MGQSKISLNELPSVKRKFVESIGDYLNRFWLLKTRCFTQVTEHDLVEMAIGGLDYSIKKELDTQYVRDMAQLAYGVWPVEWLKDEKAGVSKSKKERVASVDMDDDDPRSDVEYNHVEENEVDLAELKSGPPYVCKLLTPSNGKNPVEPEKSAKFPKKIYTLNVMRSSIFWLQMAKF